jgi:hypothetical protein
MSRHATGRPPGRPPGSGRLGKVKRVTVQLPEALYVRLDAYAEGRSSARGDVPQLPACIREALEHYLVCPQKRQTPPRAVTVPVTDTDAPQSPARRRQRQAAPIH